MFDTLELANVEYHVVAERDGRADEVRPTDDASVLGRVLAVLGAPVGPKAEQRLSVPAYLENAPAETRERFVREYLENRATTHPHIVRFREERNDSYLRELGALIEDVSGGPVTVSGKNIHLSKAAEDGLETET